MITKLNNTERVKIGKLRVGRGIGSGKGKTSGRGVKGQKSRSGVAIKSFEGGQMPLFRRLPKRGFNPLRKYKTASMNLNTIQILVEKKKLSPDSTINLDLLKKNKIIGKKFSKFKLLGNGDIKSKINVEVDFISKSAKEKLEKIGSSIRVKNNNS